MPGPGTATHSPKARNSGLSGNGWLSLVLAWLILPLGYALGASPGAERAASRSKVDPIWEQAKGEVRRGVLNLLTQHRAELERGLGYYRVTHGDRTRREIALTFDDGPHPEYTPKLLSLLGRANVKATFFMVGELAEGRPDLVKQVVAAGHCVGNHTYHHVKLTAVPIGTAAAEIKACGNVLRDITGCPPNWFRPPGGRTDTDVLLAARALGYRMVLWDVFPADSRSPGRSTIRRRVLDEASPGSIVLMHDGIQQTLDVLPGIVAILRARGYRFVTLDEMLLHRRAAIQAARR